MPSITCPGCPRAFQKEGHLTQHLHSHPGCYECQLHVNRSENHLPTAPPVLAASPTKTQAESRSSVSSVEGNDGPDPPDLDDHSDTSSLSDETENSITTLRARHLKFLQESHHLVPFNNELKVHTQLVTLMQANNIPFQMFPKFMKWRQDAEDMEGSLNFQAGNSRESVLKELKTRYGLNDKPTTTTYTLPHSQQKVQITTHDFTEQLYSLLTDPELMKDENLLFCDDDVFGVPSESKSPDFMMNDVIDGSVYQMAHKIHVKVRNRDIVIAPLVFVDKSFVDVKGRLCIEPVSFTLSCYTKEARKLPSAWRPLGFINNMSQLTTKIVLERSRDYHFILKKCLQSLIQVQHTDGIDWVLRYKNKDHAVRMKFPLLCVIGDTEGHDKCCGRKCGRSKLSSLCRYCSCPTTSTDIPTSIKEAGWKYINGPYISKLVAENDIAKLDELCYHPIENAFDDVVFCDPTRGINGAAPAEVLHVIQHGLCLYLRKGLFGTKKTKKKATTVPKVNKSKKGRTMKKKVPVTEDSPSESDSMDGMDGDPGGSEPDSDSDSDSPLPTLPNGKYDIPIGLEEQKNGVFPDSEKSHFNERAKKYGKLLVHQSDRTWEHSYFSTGITSEAKMNGHEERCVMLLILLIFCSKDGGIRYDKLMGKERLGGFVHVLTQMLLLEHFLRLGQYPKKDEIALGKHMPLFLASFKKLVNRKEGRGMKIIKFHLPLHFGGKDEGDLHRFGPASSTDTSAGESMHKDFKHAARRTQKNTANFEQQLAKSYNDSLVIRRAGQEMKALEPTHPTLSEKVVTRGLMYTVTSGGLFHFKGRRKEDTHCLTWHKEALREDVVHLFQTRILPKVDTDYIDLKISAKVDGVLYRADPSSSRHDWVNITWPGETDFFQARIITFFHASTPKGRAPIECGNGTWIHNSGHHAIVQRLEQSIYSVPEDLPDDNYLAHQESSIVYWSRLSRSPDGPNDKPLLYVVNLANNFHSPVVAVPYDLEDETEMEWLVVPATVEWHGIYQTDMDFFFKQAKDLEKKRKAETRERDPLAKKRSKTK